MRPWKPTASTSSRTASRTSPRAPRSSGGIFDYDAKKSRLIEVVRALEDPKVWDDAKKAQDLGKERRALEETLGTIERIDASADATRGSSSRSRAARATTPRSTGVETDVAGVGRLVEGLEFRRMFANPMDPNNCFLDINAGQGGTEAQDWARCCCACT